MREPSVGIDARAKDDGDVASSGVMCFSEREHLHETLKNCAAHDLEAAAHSLKGSAGNLGAQTIAAACARIMQSARASDFAPVAPFIKSIEEDFEKVKPLLLEEIKR